MKSIEITNLDQHLKPLKIGDKTTPIELSDTEFRVNEKATMEKAVEVKGDLDITGDDSSLVFNKNVSLEARSNEDYLQVNAKNILLQASTNYTDSSAGLFLAADSGFDAHISFMEAGSTNWSIGNDGGEGTSTLSFVTGAVLGTNEQMSLNANGLLEVAGDIVSGDDISMSATGKLRLDGLLGHTYIHEASADDLEIVVGGDTMATFDEANDRITMAATKHTAALANGTEFSATDSAYAGMILGYTRIQNDGTSAGDSFIAVNSSSMTVLQTAQGTDLSIQFIAPPSGNVEIQCSFWVSALSDGAKFSLSTGSSYSELDETHTYDDDWNFFIDETDHNYVTMKFAVTGLTAGTDTTYYLAGLASGAGVNIVHGRYRLSNEHQAPIIIKAMALPATIVTGE